MNISEMVISCFLLVTMALYIYFVFKAKLEDDDFSDSNINSIDYLSNKIKKIINEIINMDIDVLKLNRKDYDSRRAIRRSLRDAVRKCSQGSLAEKMIVMARIKSTLAGVLNISENNINEVIPFQNPERLSPTDKFEIMMYLEKQNGNYNMFRGICSKSQLDRLKYDEKGYYYCITEEDINGAYNRNFQPLSYDDKLNILTQKIYEETYGLSCVDLLIMEDDSIDGISGGISGITTDNYRYMEEDIYDGYSKRPKTYESIWVIYSGKPIHLQFLSFHTNANIIRTCKNLSEYGRIGHLTTSEGGLKTHLADGSRVTVFRPYNSSQWAFFVRKFASASSYELKDLITDKGSEFPIEVIKWAIHGCLNLIFSGDQNSGKTTNTRAAIREIDRRQPIRTIEADFELYLNDAYYDKNILGTRPGSKINFEKVIELLKSSDAHTILFGETASLEHARHLINLLLAGTKRVITTGHWPTSQDMISYFVHSMGAYGNSGTKEVEAMVARLLHLDIHCVKENDGHRHIDRITEIMPYIEKEDDSSSNGTVEGKLDIIADCLMKMARERTYSYQNIIVYKDGEYHMVHPFSTRLSEIILNNLPSEDRLKFIKFNQVPEGDGKEAC